MSEVEETLERIKNHKGVEGYVIADHNGNVLRRHPMMQVAEAEKYALYMKDLTTKARGVVRDLNPKNDLQYMRIRIKKLELLIAHGTSRMWCQCASSMGRFLTLSCLLALRARLLRRCHSEVDANQWVILTRNVLRRTPQKQRA